MLDLQALPSLEKFDSQLLQGFELFKAPGPADAQPAPSILNDTDADASDGALHQMMNPRARAAAAPTDGTAAALVRARSTGTGAAAAADADAALAADGASSQAHTPRAPSRGGNGNGGAGAGSALRDSGADVGGRAAKRARGVGAAAAAAAVEDTDDEMEAAFGAAAGYYGGDDCEDDYDMEDSLISSQSKLGQTTRAHVSSL
ncbi:hypothetical protein MNEG_6732 [Monoraphidium neglectum]|uniref:Uncharacterized protein n=1 Tax=Monoraphidium neglectum TaxID=145388 RepID=A0A0D2JQ83_9CHLO|nr:hypothetical protein MNEG_6732 [Monoraphidium neglectum]KIZ01233.1 hypothetical protein MNEG_6732 [Monoraphidium neglectum]|eukprot:XP_013900252.1 hypothetical protein MNEG_6732 [Monoraphidium neglectum]